MLSHNLRVNGRLTLFDYFDGNNLLVAASGYVTELNGAPALYIVSLSHAKNMPLSNFVAHALKTFAREAHASALVPVTGAASEATWKAARAALAPHGVPVLGTVSLKHLLDLLDLEYVGKPALTKLNP